MFKTILSSTSAAVMVTFLGGCGVLDPCENNILQEVTSPNDQHKAVIFSRDCGATTGFNTQVSVLAAGSDLPNDRGNIFVVDAGNSAGLKVWVKWIDSRHLKIAYSGRETVFRNEKKLDEISIQYQKR